MTIADDAYFAGARAHDELDFIDRINECRERLTAIVTSLISGELTDEEREAKREAALQNIEPIVTQNVMSLQSVSATRKVAIHRTRMVAVHEQIERMYYSRRLSEYLKEIAR